jgi:predicted DNA-binding transcriptional regulator
MLTFTINQVNQFLLSKQHLSDHTISNNIIQIVRDINGLHATDPKTPYISLFNRYNNFTKDKLDKEMFSNRTLGRIRYVRKTVYLLPRDFLSTAFSGTSRLNPPKVELYDKYLGISETEIENTSKMVLELLKGRGLTTKEVRKELQLDSNLSQIINLMCDRGQLIRETNRKSWKSNLHTYYLFSEYFPEINLNEIEESVAKERIILSYLTSHGPSTISDIAWWSGFNKTIVKNILDKFSGKIEKIQISELEGDFQILKPDLKLLKKQISRSKETVNLLPILDPYMMGYKERLRYLDHKHYNFIFDRSGNITNTILVDGIVVGIWDVEEKPKKVVKLYFFDQPTKNTKTKIISSAKKLGRFILERDVIIKECKDMVPLNQRTAGSMMRPLKDCN